MCSWSKGVAWSFQRHSEISPRLIISKMIVRKDWLRDININFFRYWVRLDPWKNLPVAMPTA